MTSYPLKEHKHHLQLSSKENQSTNSNKSSILVYTTENSNPGPSGPVILLNMTKSSTPTKISKMQPSQSNNSTKSTQGSPLSIKIEEQENGETWVSIIPPPQLAPPPPPPRMTTPRPPTPKTTQEGWETAVGLPTSLPYRGPHEWEEAEKKELTRKEHNVL